MLRYLLDTNIGIFDIRRRPQRAMAVFNQRAGRIAVSAITLAELMHGAEKSSRPAVNLAVVSIDPACGGWVVVSQPFDGPADDFETSLHGLPLQPVGAVVGKLPARRRHLDDERRRVADVFKQLR